MPPVEYSWEGVWKAEHFGLAAMRSACRQVGQRESYGEDCLKLKIYVPCDAIQAEEGYVSYLSRIHI